MKERPILFTGSNVRAILEGRKTQTRRVVKPQPKLVFGEGKHEQYAWRDGMFALRMYPSNSTILSHCPYGQPGDRLWVREGFAYLTDYRGTDPGGAALSFGCFFRADYPPEDFLDEVIRWRPSIHLPRKLSRLTLEVTAVRVERLQDISGSDALAEGVERPLSPNEQTVNELAIWRYKELWESINGPGSWDANPWVWVVEFKRVTP